MQRPCWHCCISFPLKKMTIHVLTTHYFLETHLAFCTRQSQGAQPHLTRGPGWPLGNGTSPTTAITLQMMLPLVTSLPLSPVCEQCENIFIFLGPAPEWPNGPIVGFLEHRFHTDMCALFMSDWNWNCDKRIKYDTKQEIRFPLLGLPLGDIRKITNLSGLWASYG